MGLLDQLEASLLSPILSWLRKSPVGKIVDLITHLWQSISRAWTESQTLVHLLLDEIQGWRTFRESIPARTGVISVPAAVEKTRELWLQIVDAWRSIKDLGATVKEQFQQIDSADPAADARAAIEDLESGGFKTLLQKLPKLAKGLEKILVWAGVIIQWAELWVTLADDLTNILRALKAIREEVETAGTIFLGQNRRRKTVTLTDGTKMKIRLGNLHPA